MALGFLQKYRARKVFSQLAGADRLIDLNEWQQALGLRNPLIARRLFQLVDTDDSGFIDEREYCEFLGKLLDTKSDQRYTLVFSLYDLDDAGVLDQRGIRRILQASLDEQSLQVSDADLSELAGGFLRFFKSAGKRRLESADFVSGIRAYKNIDQLIKRFSDIWLPGNSKHQPARSALAVGWWKRWRQGLGRYWRWGFWGGLYLLANGLLFAHAVQQYAAAGADTAIQLARGAGACLNLNLALVLLPVCRALWTALRHTQLGRVLPVDSVMEIHRAIGYAILAFSLLHIAAHTYHYWQSNTDSEFLLQNPAFLTGAAGIATLLLMLRGAASRKGRRRERFAASHLLYAGFIAAILLHAPALWIWLLIPAGVFFFDALFRALVKTRRVKILAMAPLADGVTSVRFAKPRWFTFYPGDYLRLRVPAISRWEWHPFTISAAPEADYFNVHIRNNGDWSGALHNLSRKRGFKAKGLRADIDGPYGAPTSAIYRAPVAVMVAAGIGVTPFASALDSLVMCQQKNRAGPENQAVYFHWLNRSQHSYEWFRQLLTRAQNKLGDDFRLFIHLTSLNHNLTNIAMQIAVEEFYRKHQRDPFTQLRAVTSPGRPNWPRFFSAMIEKHPRQAVEVYYCGPPPLARELHRHCRDFGFRFHREKFD